MKVTMKHCPGNVNIEWWYSANGRTVPLLSCVVDFLSLNFDTKDAVTYEVSQDGTIGADFKLKFTYATDNFCHYDMKIYNKNIKPRKYNEITLCKEELENLSIELDKSIYVKVL